MAVTIKQIAEYAGVSRGTVDRALNHRSGINPNVAKRIRAIAKELGYTPNRAGRALASHKKPLRIGIILNSIGNPFYDDVLRGIQKAEEEYQDFSLQIQLCQLKGYDPAAQREAIEALSRQGISALIITPMNEASVRQSILSLMQKGIPVVKLNSDLEHTEKAVYIGCNYHKSGAAAAGLLGLFSHGKALVGIVTGSEKMLGHHQRIEGFLTTCAADFPQMKIAAVKENNDDENLSYHCTKSLLEEYPLSALYFCAGGVSGGIRAVDEWQDGHPERKRPFVLCCDATAEIKELIRRGKIDATVCQQPFRQGYDSVKTVFEVFMNSDSRRQDDIYTENEIKIKYNLEK